MAAFLSRNGHSDSTLAASLARGFLHFWNGDYDACVHVAVPKVEAAARALLRELDEGIYKTQVAQDPGQYPGLYVLLRELEKLALDESWANFLRWLLLGPPGMNIRNDVAHGFVCDISPVYAALVLRAAALLITVVAPQPLSAARIAASGDDHPADLTELPRRDRDDILAILRNPVTEPVPGPWRQGAGGRAVGLAAATLRTTANVLLAQGVSSRISLFVAGAPTARRPQRRRRVGCRSARCGGATRPFRRLAAADRRRWGPQSFRGGPPCTCGLGSTDNALRQLVMG